jgi:hypothetical protein
MPGDRVRLRELAQPAGHLPVMVAIDELGRRFARRYQARPAHAPRFRSNPAPSSAAHSSARLAGSGTTLVEGEGCFRWNSRVTSRDLYSLAESAPEAIATAIATMNETSIGAVPIIPSVSRSSILPVGQDDQIGSQIVRQDVEFPSLRLRTDTISQLHIACPRSLDNAPHRLPSLEVPKNVGPQDDQCCSGDDDPSAARASSLRVGMRASWLAMNCRSLSISEKSKRA